MRGNTIKLKLVKKANCWCLTYWEKGKQKQEWIKNENVAAAIDFILENASSKVDAEHLLKSVKYLEYE